MQLIEREMFRVAKKFGLGLKSVELLSNRRGCRTVYGFCRQHSGRIWIRIRWDNGRQLLAYAIVDTMAHELAHLWNMSHSKNWFQLHADILHRMSRGKFYEKLRRRLKR